MVLCGAMVLGTGPVSAWSINSVSYLEQFDTPGGDVHSFLNVKFQIINDSVEDIFAFGVGVDMSVDTIVYDSVKATFSPSDEHPVGTWYREEWLIEAGDWNKDRPGLANVPNASSWQQLFDGIEWGELFGNYEYAYVAAGLVDAFGIRSSIPSNVTYGHLILDKFNPLREGIDFGYRITDGFPFSPIAVLFESGVFTGETNVNYTDPSPSPIPLPATGWLFLSGLSALGVLGWRRRQRVALSFDSTSGRWAPNQI